MSNMRGFSRIVIFFAAVGLAQAADISFLDQFKNIGYIQTGNGNTLTPSGDFFSADLNTSVDNAYTSVTMNYPGPGSQQNVPQVSPTDYHFQTASYPTQAAMDAAYPFGTYDFTTDTSDSASYDYTADDYPQSLPYLTGTNYSDLQGMNASQPFTFDFSPFVTGSNATSSFLFFTIYDYTKSQTVYDAGFLSPTTSSVTVPGGTLTPGDSFDYEVDYSNRDQLPSPGAVFNAQLGFDVRTDGTFTAATATPEPSTVALFGLALLAAGFHRKRKAATR